MNQTKKLIKENTRDLHQAYVDGLYTIKELEELHKTAILDEEFEIAVSIRDVLKMINN